MNLIKRNLLWILARHAAFDSGIVDDNINGAETIGGNFRGTFPVCFLCRIESHKQRVALDRVRSGLATALIDISQNNSGAILRKHLSRCLADPRCTSGNDRDLVL